jgi:hypothetical protein
MTASYEEQVGMLMAEIADLCLSGKQDWSTLERLQKALTTNGLDDLRAVADTFTKANDEAISKASADLIAKAYEGKMRDMVKSTAEFGKFEGSPVFNYAFTEKPSSTTNTAEWIKYSMRDYGAKYDPGKT